MPGRSSWPGMHRPAEPAGMFRPAADRPPPMSPCSIGRAVRRAAPLLAASPGRTAMPIGRAGAGSLPRPDRPGRGWLLTPARPARPGWLLRWLAAQAAGPAPRVTVAVWLVPLWSVQLMLTLSPGWYPLRTERIWFGEVMLWPASEVMVSPAPRPAAPAAEPCVTPAICAPPLAGIPGTWLPDATSTPRNAVEPMCTVAEPVPASI